MKLLVWNCRGTSRRGFAVALRNLLNMHKPEMVVLLEARISGANARRMIKSLGLKCFELVEAMGSVGGIWIQWNDI